MNYFNKTKQTPLLEVQHFSLAKSIRQKDKCTTSKYIIESFDLSVHKKEIVAIIGASGAGKSMLADAILGITPNDMTSEGNILYKGEPLSEQLKVSLRGKEIMMIPQMTNALNPLLKIGHQVLLNINGKNKRQKLKDAFHQVGLSTNVIQQYPHELSGGMIQKVFIAMTLVSDAQLIIADEPTVGIDEEALEDLLQHFKRLANAGKGIIFITHDIDSALKIADTIAVYYQGKTIEITKRTNFSGKGEHLYHPYTKALWNALPQNRFQAINLKNLSDKGCSFSFYCPQATELCKQKIPSLCTKRDRKVRCLYA